MADLPAHWIHLSRKADYSAFVKNGDEIQEIDFAGKTMAVDFRQ